jgi:hypothetical protein
VAGDREADSGFLLLSNVSGEDFDGTHHACSHGGATSSPRPRTNIQGESIPPPRAQLQPFFRRACPQANRNTATCLGGASLVQLTPCQWCHKTGQPAAGHRVWLGASFPAGIIHTCRMCSQVNRLAGLAVLLHCLLPQSWVPPLTPPKALLPEQEAPSGKVKLCVEKIILKRWRQGVKVIFLTVDSVCVPWTVEERQEREQLLAG